MECLVLRFSSKRIAKRIIFNKTYINLIALHLNALVSTSQIYQEVAAHLEKFCHIWILHQFRRLNSKNAGCDMNKSLSSAIESKHPVSRIHILVVGIESSQHIVSQQNCRDGNLLAQVPISLVCLDTKWHAASSEASLNR